MEFTALRIFGFVFLLLALAVIPTFADDHGSLQGKVVDDKGKGVNGAQVRIEREGAQPVMVTTNNKGEFKATDLAAGEYLVGVDAEGFKSSELIKKQKVAAGK